MTTKRELAYDAKFAKSQRGEAKTPVGNPREFRSFREGNGRESKADFRRPVTGGISRLLGFCAPCCMTVAMLVVQCRLCHLY